MKKFLWFLVGMAVIISIPILLFGPGTSPREAPSKASPQKEIEIQNHQGQKTGMVGDSSKNPVKGAQTTDTRK